MCKAIALNVPIHPLSFLSVPVSHVTNRGLEQQKEHYINYVDFGTKPLLKKKKGNINEENQGIMKNTKHYVNITTGYDFRTVTRSINSSNDHRCMNVSNVFLSLNKLLLELFQFKINFCHWTYNWSFVKSGFLGGSRLLR